MRTLALTYLTVRHRFRGLMDEVLEYALRAQHSAEAAHMPDYVAASKGNQAWIAWRNQELDKAEKLGQEALILWRQSPLVYPFQWQALFPLVGVLLAKGAQDQACGYIRLMLESTQQLLPPELSAALEAAIGAKELDQAGAARTHLDRAMELAREMGYV